MVRRGLKNYAIFLKIIHPKIIIALQNESDMRDLSENVHWILFYLAATFLQTGQLKFYLRHTFSKILIQKYTLIYTFAQDQNAFFEHSGNRFNFLSIQAMSNLWK